MQSSQPPARNSRKSRPSVEAARQAIADEVIREAISLYHQAQRAYARFEEAAAGDAGLGNVDDVLVERLGEAERHLVHAILAPSRRPGDLYPETSLYPPVGVRCDGLLYLVRPRSDDSCAIMSPPTTRTARASAS